MEYIEPHAHMVSRTTDDYRAMQLAGCAAVCEPAFWAGFDRSSPEGFRDYFSQLVHHEPQRAQRCGLRHFCWLALNPKEAEDPALADAVLEIIPQYLTHPTVLGIGEIGLNRNTRNELRVFEKHLDLAVLHNQLVLVHTPHLEDKLKGTRLILDALKNQGQLSPQRVLIDHVEEHTVKLVMDAGFWAGITLYPESKCTPARAIDMLEIYGTRRIWFNSACDWGHSDPLAVPKTGVEMKRRGFNSATVREVLWENPVEFLSQAPGFSVS